MTTRGSVVWLDTAATIDNNVSNIIGFNNEYILQAGDVSWKNPDGSGLIVPSGVSWLEFKFQSFAGGGTLDLTTATVFNIKVDNVEQAWEVPDNSYYMSCNVSTGLMPVTAGQVITVAADRYATGSFTLEPSFRGGALSAHGYDKLGAVFAMQSADQTVPNPEANMSWATPLLDTLGTHDGNQLFTAPAGVRGAIVSVNQRNVNDSPTNMQLKVWCGVYVHHMFNAQKERGAACVSSVVMPCNPGDIIKATYVCDTGTLTSQAAYTSIGIEWL